MYFGVLGGFSSVFLLAKGYSNSEIGLILAIANVVAVLIQPFLAELADRGRKSTIFIIMETITCINLILSTVMIFLGARSWLLTIAFMLCYSLMMANQPFINAVNRRLEETGVKIAFGACRSVGSMTFAVICFFLGSVVEKLGATALPVIGDAVLILIMVSILYTYRTYREAARAGGPEPRSAKQAGGAHDRADRDRGAQEAAHDRADRASATHAAAPTQEITLREFIRDNRWFLIISLGTLAIFIANSIPNTYMAQLVTSIGGDSVDVGRIFAVLAITEVPTMVLFDRIYRRVSSVTMLIVAAIAFIVWLGACAAVSSVGGLYLAQVVHFFSFPLFLPAMVRFIDENMREREAVKGQTLFTVTVTLGNMLASLIGGVILDFSGAHILMITGTLAAAIGAAIIIVSLKGKTRWSNNTRF